MFDTCKFGLKPLLEAAVMEGVLPEEILDY